MFQILDLDKECYNEKLLLKKIANCSSDIINIIYNFLNGKAKYIYNVKYEYIKKNIKDDFNKGYLFWKFINDLIEPMNKNQLINFIFKGPIQFHPNIIKTIWYSSNKISILYEGQNLINLWSNSIFCNKFNLENPKSVDFFVKQRLIYSIYLYFLQNINLYEKEYKNQLKLNDIYNNNNVKVFNKIENIYKLYISLKYIFDNLPIYN
jgi:hypothetical protein